MVKEVGTCVQRNIRWDREVIQKLSSEPCLCVLSTGPTAVRRGDSPSPRTPSGTDSIIRYEHTS